MKRTTDKILDAAGSLVDSAVKATSNIVAKGQEKADIAALENKLKRAQRQLGVLVYTLQKTGEKNDALIERYIEEIDKIRQQLSRYKSSGKDPLKVHTCPSCDTGVAKDAMFCRSCGEKLP